VSQITSVVAEALMGLQQCGVLMLIIQVTWLLDAVECQHRSI